MAALDGLADKVYDLRMKPYGGKTAEQKVIDKRVENARVVSSMLLRDITLRSSPLILHCAFYCPRPSSTAMTLWSFRVEQLSEARIVGHICEISIAACLDTVAGIELDGPGQVVEALLCLSRHAVQHRQAVVRVVGIRIPLDHAIELVARILILPLVEQ
jgi:hypothetical protein